MAFMFTHCYIAEKVLGKLRKKTLLDVNNIDDYYFGAIAPDIRYMNNSNRDITHIPFGENRVLNRERFSKYSKSFLAGYETHLIVDDVWSGKESSNGESIYGVFGVNVNDIVQKFTLYGIIDDYFQNKSNVLFQFGSASNIVRSDKNSLLYDLGFDLIQITSYKSLALLYFREPGLDTFNVFNFIPPNLDEKLITHIVNQKKELKFFLNSFVRISLEKCKDSLGEGL